MNGRVTFILKTPITKLKNQLKCGAHQVPKKVLLWLAISSRGMSKPVFFESGLAVNAERYTGSCLPAVRDFIRTHHRGANITGLPDLASSHYSKRPWPKWRS